VTKGGRTGVERGLSFKKKGAFSVVVWAIGGRILRWGTEGRGWGVIIEGGKFRSDAARIGWLNVEVRGG